MAAVWCLTGDFSRRSGDKSSPPSIAPPVQDAADVSEEKVQGDMRGLALQGEEGHREGSLPEASEDGSIQDPSPDPMDGRSLQGMALKQEAHPLLSAQEACTSLHL